jgi:hypothetical protein
MSILSELNSLISPVVPVETGVFSGAPPDEYSVLTPLTDVFDVFANNVPVADIQSVRISIYSKKNYLKLRNQLVSLILQAGFIITGRQYIGYESDTAYHHYVIDVEKYYLI